jgi:hypothetical protein
VNLSTPFHPIAFAIFPALSLYSANTEHVPLGAIGPALLASLALIALPWLAVHAWLRDGRRSAWLASCLAIAFWSYGYVVGGAEPTGLHTGLWGGIVAGCLLAAYLGGRRPGFLEQATRVANVMGIALLAVTIGQIGVALSLADARPMQPDEPGPAKTAAAPSNLPADSKRDIFVIVLDAYGREDELAEHFGLEDGLASALRERGFYVADQSSSNYNATLYSLPSALNYRYLDRVRPIAIFAGACNNVTRTQLAPHGYRFSSCATGYDTTECTSADRYIDPVAGARGPAGFRLTNFEEQLLGKTPLEPWLRSAESLSPYRRHRERILGCLDALPDLADNGELDFVLAHLLAPHEPFVFGREGQDVSPYDVPYLLPRLFEDPNPPEPPRRVGEEYARRYREQAQYIGERVARTIDEILERAEVPPIIIVHGDHGPYGFTPDPRYARFAILNAYHLPDGGDAELYPEISPVNSLRVVLNHYFGKQLPLLPDRCVRQAESSSVDVSCTSSSDER